MIEILAIAVWQQEGICGIQTLLFEHKILLYADDMVFLLQDPVNSLRVLQLILTQFSKLLGYKINESKLVIMGLNITTEIGAQISKKFDPTPWKTIVKYLGVNIKAPLDNLTLIDLNITPVIKDIQ